jgi:hypothetical protein
MKGLKPLKMASRTTKITAKDKAATMAMMMYLFI